MDTLAYSRAREDRGRAPARENLGRDTARKSLAASRAEEGKQNTAPPPNRTTEWAIPERSEHNRSSETEADRTKRSKILDALKIR